MASLVEEIRNLKVLKEKDQRWKIGSKISLSDCINKTGLIASAEEKEDLEVDIRVNFGKYKGKTYDWVKKNDFGYFNWACENIPRFKKEAL